MAETQRDLAIHITALTDGLRAGLQQASNAVSQWATQTESSIAKVEERTKNVSHLFTVMVEAFAAEQIVKGLSNIAEEAAKAETALDIAAQVAQNLGHAFDKAKAEEFLSQLATSARGSIASLDELRTGMQLLTTVTNNQEQTERAMAIAADFAAARHIGYGQAVSIVQKVLTGHVALLGRYGIATKDAAGHTYTAAQMMERLAHMTAGAADKMNPMLKAQGEMRNSFALLTEQIGQMLIPVMSAVIEKITALINWFRGLSPEAMKLIGIITGVIAVLTGIVLAMPAVVMAFTWLMNGVALAGAALAALTSPVGLVISALALLGVAVFEIAHNWTQFHQTIINIAMGIQRAVEAMVAFVIGRIRDMGQALAGVGDILTGHMKEGIAKVRAGVGNFAGAFHSVGVAAANAVSSGFHSGLNALGRGANAVLNYGKKLFSHHAVSTAGPTIPDVPFDNPPGTTKAGRGGAHRGGTQHHHVTHHHRSATEKPAESIQSRIAGFLQGNFFDRIKGGLSGLPTGRDNTAATTEKPLANIAASQEYLRHQEQMATDAGTLTKAQANAFAVQRAQLEISAAAIEKERAQRELMISLAAAVVKDTPEAQRKIAEAHKKVDEAELRLTETTNKLAETQGSIAVVLSAKLLTFHNVLGAVTEKLAAMIPGLSVEKQPGGGMKLALDPLTMFMSILEKTKSWADIQQTVNELMQVFANILDALHPVITLLLRAVIFVANGFIMLWNTIARLLNVFGLHIPLLEKINSNFNALNQTTAPLIEIIHRLPSPNELASGRIGALSPNPVSSSSINALLQQPTINALRSPDLGGGILGVLGGILGGVLALKLAMGAFAGGGLLGGLKNILGGGKGILGTIESALGSHLSFLGGATIGSALLAAGGGAIVGTVLEKALGLKSGAPIGGAIGGVVGAAGGLGMIGLAGGPIGAIAGALIGSIIGGVFGHKDNQNAMPDKYATNEYGQMTADLVGANPNVNGQSFTESSQVSQALGGKSELQFISDYIKSGGKALDPATMAKFSGATSITSLKEGFLTLNNGLREFWSTMGNDARDAITKIGNSFQDLSNSVTGNLAAGATDIRAHLSAAGNDLAGNVASGACGGMTAAINAIGQKVTDPVSRRLDDGLSGSGDVTHTTNIYGDVNGMADVQDIAQTQADFIARSMRNRRYLLSQISGS